MAKNLKPKNNLLKLSFEGKCLNDLQRFVSRDGTGDKSQVEKDLKRIHGLTIKGESKEWSYTRETDSDETTQLPKKKLIEPDPDEVFFHRINSLDAKFKDTLLLHFHQGGMFFAARQFLEFDLNSKGFAPPSVDGSRHHIACDFSPRQMIITEKFSVSKLIFLPEESNSKFYCDEKGEFGSCNLEESEQEKKIYFQNHIKEKLNSDQEVELSLTQEAEPFQLSSAGQDLIEFTVKHTITLDPESKEIIVKKLSKEDVTLKVLLPILSLTSKTPNLEFSKLLTPELRYVLVDFEKPRSENKVKELILNSYQELIILLLNIIFYLISQSPIPEKKALLSSQALESDGLENNFANRMRA